MLFSSKAIRQKAAQIDEVCNTNFVPMLKGQSRSAEPVRQLLEDASYKKNRQRHEETVANWNKTLWEIRKEAQSELAYWYTPPFQPYPPQVIADARRLRRRYVLPSSKDGMLEFIIESKTCKTRNFEKGRHCDTSEAFLHMLSAE